MKKISVVFALLMMMGFTQVAASATLTWGAMPGASHVTLDNNQTISAAYGFGVFKGGFSHAYNFSSVNPSHVMAYAIELLNENISITSISLDGIMMTFDKLNQRWQGMGTLSTTHSLQLTGTVSAIGQQYLVSAVSAVPIPAALWLFGSAFAGLVGLSTRKVASKAITA